MERAYERSENELRYLTMKQNPNKEFDHPERSSFSSANANKYANMMGPVIGNIGNLQFVLTAVLGGLLSVAGWQHHSECYGFLSAVHKKLPSLHTVLSDSMPLSWRLQVLNESSTSDR